MKKGDFFAIFSKNTLAFLVKFDVKNAILWLISIPEMYTFI